MNPNEAEKLYEKVCKRWQTQPSQHEKDLWIKHMATLSQEEAVAAINERIASQYGQRVPYAKTIYSIAMKHRAETVNSQPAGKSLPSGYPDEEKDNERFAAMLARDAGVPVEQLDAYITQYLRERGFNA